jgi:hypothetical protein
MNGYSICTSNICHNMNGYCFHAEGIYEWGCISNSSVATVTNFTLTNTSMGDWRIMGQLFIHLYHDYQTKSANKACTVITH